MGKCPYINHTIYILFFRDIFNMVFSVRNNFIPTVPAVTSLLMTSKFLPLHPTSVLSFDSEFSKSCLVSPCERPSGIIYASHCQKPYSLLSSHTALHSNSLVFKWQTSEMFGLFPQFPFCSQI